MPEKYDLNVIYVYQQTLLGKGTTLNNVIFTADAHRTSDNALAILRYVVEEHLRWSPHEMCEWFNERVIKRMKLERIIARIPLPPEVEPTDYFIYAHMLYPKEIPMDFVKYTKLMYNKVLSGARSKFPRGFFDDVRGRDRAIVCLRYILTDKVSFKDTRDLYLSFVATKGNSFLQRWRLYKARKLIWDAPVDFLHDALTDDEKDMLYYTFVKIMDARLIEKVGEAPPARTKTFVCAGNNDESVDDKDDSAESMTDETVDFNPRSPCGERPANKVDV